MAMDEAIDIKTSAYSWTQHLYSDLPLIEGYLLI